MSALLTPDECAEQARCSARTIRRQIQLGKLKATRVGSLVRIRPQDWEEYLCQSGVTVRGGKSEFSMVAGDLAKLLRLAPTLNSSKERGNAESTITELAAYRHTRSKKHSRAG